MLPVSEASDMPRIVQPDDFTTVLKSYQACQHLVNCQACKRTVETEILREAAVYKYIPPHPQILYCYGLEETRDPGVHGLRFEFTRFGDVRTFIRQTRESPPPMETRLRMSVDVAKGLSHLHSQGVQHCDLSCRNLYLFKEYRVKIGNLSGGMVAGNDELKPVVREEAAFELPLRGRAFKDRPVRARELFALGSTLYEILFWEHPCDGYRDHEITFLFELGYFPHTGTTKDLFHRCWFEKYQSADELVTTLESMLARLPRLFRSDTAWDNGGPA
ncbi:hypothetical protein S7711_08348 [Stachybotrys chartarum IBT 7711]|uniref:EKC/KEOPS complex subunit BUD32 n=1 Tax=Stachybotrys chartarum (strain CBS 109288 / IBT 7711) TaxID=1280523 RepID=A0A084AS81_STACB|nr:hypothetical protein S7711_08348 [Stachybotrys chartarum IBT 7711]KFA76630.1 hypothetical protein S40288_11083 [Stachybotrys chartarum IBT 40288]